MIDGVPAGVHMTRDELGRELARRRGGHGRGARMSFEADDISVLGGFRHGVSMGSPIAIRIGNTEWPKWETVMSPDPVSPSELDGVARAQLLTRPRPGHADLAGIQKYGFEDARPVLERASARETAARTSVGFVAKCLIDQVLGVRVFSHVVGIGPLSVPVDAQPPTADDIDRIEADPIRCAYEESSREFIEYIDERRSAGDTVGGVVEVRATGLPPGLGSYAQWDRRLDGRLAAAVMSIQAIKGVEVGDGFAVARTPGSMAHDEMSYDDDHVVGRTSNRAGGVEGGMSNGEDIVVRAAMKPIATVPRALSTVDIATGEDASAHHQRSDVCAVAAAGVVAESMVALTIADVALEKFGGDSVEEMRRNAESYVAAAAPHAMWESLR